MNAEIHHLAAAYALDALDPEERRAFEAHYPSCAVCVEEVIDYRRTATELAAAQEQRPSAQLRDRVLAEIAETRQNPPRVVELDSYRPSRVLLGAVAASVLLLVGVIVARTADSGPDMQVALIELLASPDIDVQPLDGDSAAVVTVAWSADVGSVAVLGSGLDGPGAGMVYALWLLNDDGATASLLFSPDDDGLVESVGRVSAAPNGWGITIEPRGGSPQPTGDIIFSAEI